MKREPIVKVEMENQNVCSDIWMEDDAGWF